MNQAVLTNQAEEISDFSRKSLDNTISFKMFCVLPNSIQDKISAKDVQGIFMIVPVLIAPHWKVTKCPPYLVERLIAYFCTIPELGSMKEDEL